MKKKTILVVVIFLTVITAVFAQTTANFNVELTADGTGVIIKKYTGSAVAVSIPDTIEGLPVKEIGNDAFGASSYGATFITSITLPQGLIKIGAQAFSSQSRLTAIVIPNGVTEIGDNAFSGCYALTSITIPDSVTFLGNYVFTGAGIETVTLGKGITIIPWGTFGRCKFTSLIIPEGVTEIGGIAFQENISLISVTLPSTIEKISERAFENCGVLTTVIIPDTVEVIEFYRTPFYRCSKLNLASQAAIRRRGYTDSF
jgi:hypothetical protein